MVLLLVTTYIIKTSTDFYGVCQHTKNQGRVYRSIIYAGMPVPALVVTYKRMLLFIHIVYQSALSEVWYDDR